jgi:hypothetical protein
LRNVTAFNECLREDLMKICKCVDIQGVNVIALQLLTVAAILKFDFFELTFFLEKSNFGSFFGVFYLFLELLTH